jgi:acarbose 7IV-phosphotransferase
LPSGIDAVKASGKPVWVGLHDYDGRNPYYEPFIEVATHIQFSAEATANRQSLMSRFIAQGKAVALCTDGKRGASLMTADGVQLQQQLSPGLHVVDSDGAGDAFFVGYLYGWLTKQPPQTCLQMATSCGGYTVTEKRVGLSRPCRAWLQQRVA